MNYNYKNKKIFYNINGAGNTLVFLHGFTESADIWNDFSENLSKYYSILTIDLPGHGNSEALNGEHTMEEMAHIVKSVLDFNNIKNCLIVGHSMGGYVALAFAEAFPEYLKGLCLFHSSALDDTPEIKLNREKTIKIVKKNKFSYLKQFIPDLFAPENKIKFTSEIKKLIDCSEAMSSEGIINSITGMKNRKTRTDVLAKINVPVLFIAGKKDNRIPVEKIIQQIILPHHSESLILGNVGHMGYIEARELTLNTILNFSIKIYSK